MISLTAARRHLRIDGNEHDEEISQKLTQATALVETYTGLLFGFPPISREVDIYLNTSDDPEYPDRELGPWDMVYLHGDTIDAATLMVLGDLWVNRESSTGNPLSPAVKNLLNIIKEPGYA